MLSSKSFQVIVLMAIYCMLITDSIEGYSYGWHAMPITRQDIVSQSEVNKVLSDPIERERLSLLVDQIYSKWPQKVPPCPYRNDIYDPVAKACSKPNTQGHCQDNMVFLPVPNTENTIGACACKTTGCWGRPQVLFDNNQCYGIATQGPCADGETLIPTSTFQVKCSKDACFHGTPQWAINFSQGSKVQRENYPVFAFTYKGNCYITESEAFCGSGRVVRFVVPYKIPVCVDRNEVRCAGASGSGYALQATAYRGFEPGSAPHYITGICQRTSGFDLK